MGRVRVVILRTLPYLLNKYLLRTYTHIDQVFVMRVPA